jgi:hypothetical protein
MMTNGGLEQIQVPNETGGHGNSKGLKVFTMSVEREDAEERRSEVALEENVKKMNSQPKRIKIGFGKIIN